MIPLALTLLYAIYMVFSSITHPVLTNKRSFGLLSPNSPSPSPPCLAESAITANSHKKSRTREPLDKNSLLQPSLHTDNDTYRSIISMSRYLRTHKKHTNRHNCISNKHVDGGFSKDLYSRHKGVYLPYTLYCVLADKCDDGTLGSAIELRKLTNDEIDIAYTNYVQEVKARLGEEYNVAVPSLPLPLDTIKSTTTLHSDSPGFREPSLPGWDQMEEEENEVAAFLESVFDVKTIAWEMLGFNEIRSISTEIETLMKDLKGITF